MAWDNKIPFNPHTGEQQSYPQNVYGPSENGIYASWPPEWRENTEFDDVLTFVDFERGRSAANAVFQRLDGSRCHMFLSDLSDALPLMVHARVTGRFTWCKRGANFGIKLMPGVRPLVQPVQPVEVSAVGQDSPTPKQAGCGYLVRAQQQIHAGDLR